jgi:hypothetical protein
MAEGKPADKFEEAVSDGEAPKEAQSISRIRANSSIMQLKKILGRCSPSVRDVWKRRRQQCWLL